MMSIGIAFYLFIMEVLWVYTKKDLYYRQLRFWLKIFVFSFSFGVASGFPMAFQFGTNWSGFANSAGSFFGNIIGFETTVAFTLEATFLGILIFGWNKVPKLAHLLANFLVLFGASLSAFWILAANSWMQVPDGVHMEAGKVIVDNYFSALFNRDILITYLHKWFACIETSIFLMGGISAWAIMRHKGNQAYKEFFLHTLKFLIILAVVVTPLEAMFGDISGVTVAKLQPEKVASYELHWDTNREGEGAPLHLLAWPNKEGNGNAFSISIPYGLSLLTTHSLHGVVPGLNSFPQSERPTKTEAVLTFYAFRVMVAIGLLLMLLMLVSILYWKQGKLNKDRILSHRTFLYVWVASIPLGFIAAEAGWMVREIGRQPWMIYHMLKVSDSLSVGLNQTVVGILLYAIVALYVTLLCLLAYFIRKTVIKGPDLTSTIH
jgi:cytochrome d ubiquinol oxidase subunit I